VRKAGEATGLQRREPPPTGKNGSLHHFRLRRSGHFREATGSKQGGALRLPPAKAGSDADVLRRPSLCGHVVGGCPGPCTWALRPGGENLVLSMSRIRAAAAAEGSTPRLERCWISGPKYGMAPSTRQESMALRAFLASGWGRWRRPPGRRAVLPYQRRGRAAAVLAIGANCRGRRCPPEPAAGIATRCAAIT